MVSEIFSHLFNICTLSQVMSCTQQLDVFRFQRRTTLREWKDVIEVELIRFSTDHAFCFVACPNFKFYIRWNDASPFRKLVWRVFGSRKIRDLFHSNKFKLKYRPVSARFLPRVHQMKESVVGPDTISDLLIHLHDILPLFAQFKHLSSLVELTIFGQIASRLPVRLIERFRVGDALSSWLVMPFVNQGGSIILHFVTVRRITAHRHQNDGMATL